MLPLLMTEVFANSVNNSPDSLLAIEIFQTEIVSLTRIISEQRDSISRIKSDLADIQKNNIDIVQQYQYLQTEITLLKQSLIEQSCHLSSFESDLAVVNQRISVFADTLSENINTNRLQIRTNTDSLKKAIVQSSQWEISLLTIIAVVVAVGILLFRQLIVKRKNEVITLSAKTEELTSRTDKLNEAIVDQLVSESKELQIVIKQFESTVNISGITTNNEDSEQKLIIALADRITFMEMTLYKMDSSVRGHKQLSKSIQQMKDNLLAHRYELVDMLGKDYHNGMKVTANFIEDEDLPQGKQVITSIIKPQINYKGKMIQSAQITVSQNL